MSDDFVGTTEVRHAHRFDQDALRTWFSRNVDSGAAKRFDVSQFKGGQSNPTFLVDVAGGRYVVRRKPLGHVLASAHAVDREFRVMQALRGTDVPVPETYALCEDDSVIGSSFYVMAFVEGRILWDPTLPGLSYHEREKVCREMNRTIAALHEIDAAKVGLADYGRPGNFVERQINRWTRQYRASETERIGAMEDLIAWLPSHVPAVTGQALVHGDFRLDNLVFAAGAPRIIAVLDWELSTLGDPVADFAYHCMAWHLHPPARGLGHLDPRMLGELGIPSESEYASRYVQARGIAPIDQDTWKFYLAFSFFRAAAIAQGIMGRVIAGNAASLQAMEYGKQVAQLAAFGRQQMASS